MIELCDCGIPLDWGCPVVPVFPDHLGITTITNVHPSITDKHTIPMGWLVHDLTLTSSLFRNIPG